MNDFKGLLRQEFAGVFPLSEEQLDLLYGHFQLLLHWNKRLNLTTLTRLNDAVPLHYCESLYLGTVLPPNPVSVVDIGSGAGFPGVPMAILRPDCAVTLVEVRQKKAVFLKEATRVLANVEVCGVDANDFQESRDWVVSRAVRWEDVVKIGAGIGKSIALLLGENDCADARRCNLVKWQPPRSSPWGRQRYILIGSFLPDVAGE